MLESLLEMAFHLLNTVEMYSVTAWKHSCVSWRIEKILHVCLHGEVSYKTHVCVCLIMIFIFMVISDLPRSKLDSYDALLSLYIYENLSI